MNAPLATTALATALLLPGALLAAEDAPAQSACIKSQVAGAQAQGWRLRGVDADSVPAAKETGYRMTLYKGSRYLFLACTDTAGAGMRMEALDEAGAVTQGEQSGGKAPLLSLGPKKTASYAVRLFQTAGPENLRFSIAVLYR